jgi:flagellar L-ring protein precursor FlgH
MMRMLLKALVVGSALFAAIPCAFADDLYQGGNWASLAADRKASQVGDLITIQVLANNTATNSVSQASKRRTSVDGRITAGTSFDKSAGIGFGGGYDGEGGNTRANRMAAQLSATVTEVLPNGDLMVSGWQTLDISGEKTNIRVTGRVRRDDISADNAVLSSRLAEAKIEYDGKGFASRSAKPGIVTRIFNWMGLL